MATNPNTIAQPENTGNLSVRSQVEQLLENFYGAVGIMPRQSAPANATELLADNFEGRFFMRTSSELLCFDKSQMLEVRLGMGDVRPTSRLLAMTVSDETEGAFTASYTVALRYGQTAIVHRGTLKAVRTRGRWVLRSVDEDVRTRLMPEPRRKFRGPSDLPRVWIR